MFSEKKRKRKRKVKKKNNHGKNSQFLKVRGRMSVGGQQRGEGEEEQKENLLCLEDVGIINTDVAGESD